MSLTDRLRSALHATDSRRVDPDALIARVDALGRFANAAGPHVPPDDLRPATDVVARAGGRLALSRDHTVVALAGATGSGKSSLFNRLAGADLSDVGVRRPTTGLTHARVWGADDASALLDWLGVPPNRRFPEGVDASGTGLDGMVLLDLPDFDSVHLEHRWEVDRLLRLVDLIVWVTDPQKYADQVIHDQYLRTFHKHRDITVVVLNQADRLSATDVDRCVADLRLLLDRDGIGEVPTMAVSATSDRPGIEDFIEVLRGAVAARMAALARLAADVDLAVERLEPLASVEPPKNAIDRDAVRRLDQALAISAGVPAVTDATARAYRFRAGKAMGWPVTRWLRHARVDPLRRLRLGMSNAAGDPASLPAASGPQRSTATLALRALADRAGAALPVPWPAAVTRAARAHETDLPDALDRAIVGTDLGVDRKPFWWRLFGALQWLVTLAALAGAVWLLARILLIAIGLPAFDVQKVGAVPLPTVLLVGGVLAGILLSLLVKPLVAAGAGRARRRALSRMTASVSAVSQDLVIAPVRQVLDDYREANSAIRASQR